MNSFDLKSFVSSKGFRTTSLCLGVALVSFFVYPFLFAYSGIVGRVFPPTPDWLAIGDRGTSALVWMHVGHMTQLVLASVPIGLGYALLIPRQAMKAAVATMLTMLLFSAYFVLMDLGERSARQLASAAVDLAKFVFTLPVLTWIFLRMIRRPQRSTGSPGFLPSRE